SNAERALIDVVSPRTIKTMVSTARLIWGQTLRPSPINGLDTVTVDRRNPFHTGGLPSVMTYCTECRGVARCVADVLEVGLSAFLSAPAQTGIKKPAEGRAPEIDFGVEHGGFEPPTPCLPEKGRPFRGVVLRSLRNSSV